MSNEATAQPVCAVRARVDACTPVCREHVAIECVVDAFPPSAPGQFLQLLCLDSEQADSALVEWSDECLPALSDKDLRASAPFLRRPFSIADQWSAPGGDVHLRVLSRNVGPGTRWLERLRAGDTLDLTGPLGRGFRIPTGDAPLLLLGGGVGIPPLLYLARRLHELGRRDVIVCFGARTRDLLPVRLVQEPTRDATPTRCVELPAGAPYPAIVAGDDGSVGWRGSAVDALRAWHVRHGRGDRPAVVFACGPEAMLKAVARTTRALALSCQLCIERQMGCGLGTCLSCVVRVRDARQATGWRWALACQDGPVFDRDDLLDYASVPGA